MKRRTSQFRGCVDLHGGRVKQIVGGTLSDERADSLRTNFIATEGAAYYARLYRDNAVHGAHVIKLGPGNDDAAREALAAWPGGLQIGGGIDASNALDWLAAGASKVIVTSYLFPDAKFALDRLRNLAALVGPDRLVVDLSCRRVPSGWCVAMNKWQTLTDTLLSRETLATMAPFCSEFLIHAADVEGLCRGIDEELVVELGRWTTLPCTYAGGAASIADLANVDRLTDGKVDLTFGSALDIFGGKTVAFADCVHWNRYGELPSSPSSETKP